MNKVRVHFFFTEEQTQASFWRFLSNTEIELRLTDGPYWEATMVGATTGFPLQYFSDKEEV